jgi:hypothetical protein
MSIGSTNARFSCRTSTVALFLQALIALYAMASLAAAEPPATYTRFCVTCGLRDIETFSSQSGQFIVHGTAGRRLTPRPPTTNGTSIVEVEPQLIAVTAERTRQAFIRELELTDSFLDRIHIAVLNFAPPNQPIGIISQINTDGFVYRIGMPPRVPSVQVMKALIQTLLLEYANRGAGRCAELPTWLVEGMTRQLLTRIVPASVFNSEPLTIERAGYDRLGDSKTFLQTNIPLTIQEISFPDFAKATSAELTQFEASAHLLVHQLLQLPNGPKLMTRFIQSLPQTLNWQTTFFQVYREHFNSPLSFEKWWMLNWVAFKGRQERETWTVPVALERLEAILATPMEIRSDTNSLPAYQDAPLQSFLKVADFGVQKDLLSQKLQHLFFVSLNVPPAVLPVWSAYEQTIDSYLQKRIGNDLQPSLKSDPEQRLQALINSTLKTLDQLDQARVDLMEGRPPLLPREFNRPPSRQASR